LLFMVAAMAAKMEYDLIRERTLDALRPPRPRRAETGPLR
jgi:DNA invertase Pin-like site-specific DNA recombinase